MNYWKENVRIIFSFNYLAYSSQSRRRNFINEIIEEEDEDKNKEKDKREKSKNRHNPKIMNKNNNNNKINENLAKPTLIWSNSQFNKKTYENLFYKKTFDKYVPIREKLINNDNKKSPNNHGNEILPDLQTQNFTNIENSKNIKSAVVPKNNLRSKSIDKTANPQQSKNANINTNINNNNINSTNDTSAFTHSSKKYFSPRAIYTQNYTEDLSNFRMGLLSAGSSCNNNIIIPMLPFRRPVSNFNFGVGQLRNNFENSGNINAINKENAEEKAEEKNGIKDDKENNNEEQREINKKEFNFDYSNLKRNYNIYNKVNSASRNNKPFKHTEMKKRLELFQTKNDINNLYIGMDKMITKLHKIKIEKGMMNSGIVNSLNKKFNRDYQNQIEQFKKSHLPKVFDNKGGNDSTNNDKNKLRSHSFNNKNNFY